MLERAKSPLANSKAEALVAFVGVEGDLQAKYPTMLYSDILAHCHAELKARLRGETSVPHAEQSIGVTEMSTSDGGTMSQVTNAGTSGTANDAASEGLTEEDIAFGKSIAKWTPFPDTIPALVSLQKHYKLAILSNVDRSSFSATKALLERSDPANRFTLDAVYTAQDIGSYKPDTANFEYALQKLKEQFGIERDQVLVTANSLLHDHVPANVLGLNSVHIKRTGSVIGQDSKANFTWRFDTMGDMAREVDKQAGTS